MDCLQHEIPYFVTRKVWEIEAGLSFHFGILCVKCLEHRIGRALLPEDFTVR